MLGLRPFWNYYGGKWRTAPRYPAPLHGTIIEPFAGAAGYSMRYPDRSILLIDKYDAITETWRWLIGARPADVMAIPIVDHVDDLPGSTPEGARLLVGWNMNTVCASPRRTRSRGVRAHRENGRLMMGWHNERRDRVASQVNAIKHWRVMRGGYADAPDASATWFIDPPYSGASGEHYKHKSSAIDFSHLADWCKSRRGQAIVCENIGADWLPFSSFVDAKAGPNGSGRSAEVVWLSEAPCS